MTHDEIIEMAKEAGFDEHHAKFDTRIETFAKLAAEAERAAFKQIIRETPFSNWFQADVIEAIDKRGQA